MDIDLVSAYSYDNAWWVCEKCGYKWKTSIKGRNERPDNCPCCDSNKAINPGYNDILTIVPELSDIYDFEKNKNIDIYFQGISSKQFAFFKCNTCGHKWRSTIGNRVVKEKDNSYRVVGCPKCNRVIFRKYPELKIMFNEKLNRCTFDSLMGKDYRRFKYWWSCNICGNHFKNKIQYMIESLKTKTKGCPYCSNTIPIKGNSFADIHPELMDEYDSKNTIDAFTVFPGSKKTENGFVAITLSINGKQHLFREIVDMETVQYVIVQNLLMELILSQMYTKTMRTCGLQIIIGKLMKPSIILVFGLSGFVIPVVWSMGLI